MVILRSSRTEDAARLSSGAHCLSLSVAEKESKGESRWSSNWHRASTSRAESPEKRVPRLARRVKWGYNNSILQAESESHVPRE